MLDKKTRLWILVGILIIIIINLLVFLPEQEKEVIKVGAIIPLSGSAAIWGESVRNGMEIAIEELVDEGINIEALYEDSQADPKQGVSAYRNLRLKGVDVILSLSSRVSVPLIPLADNDKIPLIMTAVSATAVADESPYVFRFYADDHGYVDAHFNNINKGKYSTIAILYLNDDFGISVSKAIRENAKQKGIQILIEEKFEAYTTDFKTQLTKIKAKNPDVIMFVDGVPIEIISVLKQISELGIDADFYEVSALLSVESIRKSAQSEGVFTTAFPFVLEITGEEFRNKYEEKYGEYPFFAAAFGYDTVKLIAQASDGESISGKELSNRIISLEKYDSLNGEIDIQSNGEINPQLYSTKIVNGELEIVK